MHPRLGGNMAGFSETVQRWRAPIYSGLLGINRNPLLMHLPPSLNLVPVAGAPPMGWGFWRPTVGKKLGKPSGYLDLPEGGAGLI